ncbi:MAG: amidase [Actinomycetota bacterium]
MANRSTHAFTDDALGSHDAVGLAAEIAAGNTSAIEAIDAALARAEAVNGDLNAIAKPLADRARTMAAEGTAGVFAGVPTYIKDTDPIAGVPNRLGSRAMPDTPATESSPFVVQYESTGVIPLGTSNLPEFGLLASTEPVLTGVTRNPWSLDHTPGGSSGGSAAMVAAGVVPIAHANDGGGSIRIPASCCGLVGLKTTRSRLRNTELPKVIPINIAVQGMVSRTVRDTAMFVHGAEQHHRNPDLPAVGHVTNPLDRPLRIGMFTAAPEGVIFDSRAVGETQRVGELCEQLGHTVEAINHPFPVWFTDDFLLYWGLIPALLWRVGKRALSPEFDRDQLEPWTKHLARHFNRNLPRVPAMVRRLRRFEHEYRAVFQHYDVLLSPTLAKPTPEIGYFDPSIDSPTLMARSIAHVPITPFLNVSGGPGISLPLATDTGGRPLGIHFAADLGQDALLLQLALQLEEASPWKTLADG